MQRIQHSGDAVSRDASRLNRFDLEDVCHVVRRTLTWQYRTASYELIVDAVQEAACKYCEQDRLRAEVNRRTIYTWVLTTARHELSHALRREDRFASESALESMPDGDRPAGGSDEPFVDDLTFEALFEGLSPILAEAVRMHFDGFTAQEIARDIGCTEAAAHKRVQWGCRELRWLWSQEETRLDRLLP
jgi:RNA polymerase sigma factor (sigma-70 family)